MPDPNVALPARVEKRGDAFVAVDANGKRLAGTQGFPDEARAQDLVRRVNAAWEQAKKERTDRGAPAVTTK